MVPALKRTVGTVTVSVVLACGGGGGDGGTTPPPPPPPPPAPVATVDISPASATIVPQGTVTLTATARDASGNTLTRTVSWASSDATKASVSTAGVVTGVAAGTTTITATSEGRSATATISVKEGGMIGAAGGTITALNGVVKLTVPSGAVAANTMITVETAVGVPANARLVPQTAVELGPSGLTFSAPVKLDLSYQVSGLPAGPPERLLAIHRVVTGAWQAVAGATVDQAAKTVSANLTSFSTYGILTAPFVDNLLMAPPNAQITPGETIQLSATPRDAANATLAGRDPPTWSSGSSAVATVNALGLVTGVAVGAATITATLEGKTATVTVTVLQPGSPVIASVSPATLLPGGSGTVTGSNFGTVTSNLALTVAGVPAGITSSTATTINFTLPATGLPCQLTQAVPVAVTRTGVQSASVNHPLRTATQRSFALGESVHLLTPSTAGCNELSLTGGEYVMYVVNSTGAASASTTFELYGAGGTGAMQTQTLAPPVTSAMVARSPELDEMRGFAEAHLRHLEIDRERARSLAFHGSARLRSGTDRVSAVVSTTIGAVSTVNVQNLTATSCGSVTPIQARTVFVGPRAIVVEDIAAPLAGTMDATFTALGDLYETSMHDILVENAGDPLLRDAMLDNNGRLVMVFTPVVNNSSAFAFVTACDALPSPQNNNGEYFYSRVPTTSTGTNTSTSNLLGWSKFAASVVIHEVKHIASHAARVNGAGMGQPNFEESFLEEGTAQLLEEIWTRTRAGFPAKGNVDYMTGLFCDWRFTGTVPPQCANWYISMYNHFDRLHDYLAYQASRSLFGSTASDDITFYGSVWSFVRWMVDAFATNEGAFMRALVQSPTMRGIANIEARTGRPIAELIGMWAIALFTDDRSTFTVNDPKLAFPSWNLPNVFAGLNSDFSTQGFPNASPFVGYTPNFGNFQVGTSARGGTGVLVWLRGTQTGPQLLRLTGQGGAALPAGFGLAIVRVR